MIRDRSQHLVRYFDYGKTPTVIYKNKDLPANISDTHKIVKNIDGWWLEWHPIPPDHNKVMIELIDWSVDLYGRFDGITRMTKNSYGKNIQFEFVYYWGA